MEKKSRIQESSAIDNAKKWAKAFIDATNSHEASRIASFFAEDGDRINICEEQVIGEEHGRAEVEENYKTLFAVNPKITQILKVETARFLSSELMIIDGIWGAKNLQDGNDPGGRFVVINKYEGGRWVIIASRIYWLSSFLNFFSQNQ